MSSAELDKIEPHVHTRKIMDHGNNLYGQDKLIFYVKEVGALNLPESELCNKPPAQMEDFKRDSHNHRVLRENILLIFLPLEIREAHPRRR